MKYCNKCGNELTLERAFGTRDEEFYYTCTNCEYSPKEDRMIVVKTEMTQMPDGCRDCRNRWYSFAEEKYMCRETLEDIIDGGIRLDSCPLVEIRESEK